MRTGRHAGGHGDARNPVLERKWRLRKPHRPRYPVTCLALDANRALCSPSLGDNLGCPHNRGMNVPLRLLLRGLALRCPRCGRGHISASLFNPVEACPACRAPIETRTGEVTGGMAINLVTTTILATIGIWWGAVFERAPILPLVLGLVLGGTLFSLAFHRHACGLWVGALYLPEDIGEAPTGGQAGLAPAGRGRSSRTGGADRSGDRRISRVRSAATMHRAPDNQNADS